MGILQLACGGEVNVLEVRALQRLQVHLRLIMEVDGKLEIPIVFDLADDLLDRHGIWGIEEAIRAFMRLAAEVTGHLG